MQAILTADDRLRTRYRNSGDCTTPVECIKQPIMCQFLEELPRIPDWPLSGPAPQYLSDDRDTVVRAGDTVLERLDNTFVVRTVWMADDIGWSDGMTLWGGCSNGSKAWLICRQDNSEDA